MANEPMPTEERTPVVEEEFPLPMYSSEEGQGQIQIESSVIEHIASTAALEIEGVSLGSRPGLADTIARLGRPGIHKGVRVIQTDNGGYSIELMIRMAYGIPMRDTAIKLQRHIKEVVQRMTSLSIERVDVKIIDIYHQKDKREREREEEED